jgi:hypothetical protein
MHDVFISYSGKNQFDADLVKQVLQSNGIRCWMAPDDIPSGENYAKSIPAAIEGCRIFVLLLSGAAQMSPWVSKELDLAVNGSKVIIPFVLEECELLDEFNFYLIGAQRLNAYQKKSDALQSLVGRTQALLSLETAPTIHVTATTRLPDGLHTMDPDLDRRIAERAAEYIAMDYICSMKKFRKSDPEKLRRNLHIPEADEIFLAFDDTLFRSGKNGFAVASSGIYHRSIMEKSESMLCWSEFLKIEKFLYSRVPSSCLKASTSEGMIEIAEIKLLRPYNCRYLLRFLERLRDILCQEFA